MADRWITSENLDVVRDLSQWAAERGRTIVELAFAWLLADPIVATVIAGASSREQIAQNARASEWQLSQDDRAEVNAILDAHEVSATKTYFSRAGYFDEQVEVEFGD